MPLIPQEFNYEIHKPLGHLALQVFSTALLPEREKAAFLRSMEAAGNRTGGPVMEKGGVACARASELERLYWESVKKGIDPCYRDRRDGYVYIGAFVFVPTKIPIIVRPEDAEDV